MVVRRFAAEHPSLFRLTFRNTADPFMHGEPTVRAASAQALDVLAQRVARLQDAGLLAGRTVDEATLYLRALCDGLAGLELGGSIPSAGAERFWREALGALVCGFRLPTPPP